MPRRPRSPSHATRAEALAAIEAARHASVRICTEARIGGAEYEAAGKAMQALDDLAGALTGNREMFWSKPHGTGQGARRRCASSGMLHRKCNQGLFIDWHNNV